MKQKFKESIVLGNTKIERSISVFKNFKEFNVISTQMNSVIFSDKQSHNFTIFLIEDIYDFNGAIPFVVVNNFKEKFPHFLQESITISNITYNPICLFQREKIVVSSLSLEDKIKFLLDCLSNLLFLKENEIEQEFQKEFLYYWNQSSSIRFIPQTFITCDEKAKFLDYYIKNSTIRVNSRDKKLNDSESWKKQRNLGIYIPIIDSEDILPPTKENKWSYIDILKILANPQKDKISVDSYKQIKNLVIKRKTIDLYFSLPINQTRILFGCKIVFKNAGAAKLIEKIISNVEKIEIFKLERNDYGYLHASIGNEVIDKKIGIVGIGSLGSYIANELLQSGAKDLTLFDNDYLIPENTFRHYLGLNVINIKKSAALKFYFEEKHPEILINAIEDNISPENIQHYVNEYKLDYLVFCVGSTDIQVDISKKVSKLNLDVAIIYVWLNENGTDSYTLVTFDNKNTCYICGRNYLESFSPAEKSTNVRWLNDGCGGTRIKYGTRTLLSATNGFLYAFEKSLTYKNPFGVSASTLKGIEEVAITSPEGCDYCGT